MIGDQPTIATAVVKPTIGALMALGIFLLGSVAVLLFIVCFGTIATFISTPGFAGLASAFVLGWIALLIFGVEAIVGALLTVLVGLPLGALFAMLIRRTTPLAVQLALFFAVGIVSAGVLIVLFSVGTETGDDWALSVVEGLFSPVGLGLAVVTGMCAAAGWLASTAIFLLRESLTPFTIGRKRPVSAT